RRMDAHAARMEAFELKRRADEEEQQAAAREFEEPIELPPDLGEPDDPSAIEDTDTHEHQPGGELHAVAAKNEEPAEVLGEDEEPASALPEPPLETEADAGGVPLSYGNVPTSYVHGEDQSEFEIPEPEMTTDARRRKPRGNVVSQPISVSLNED